MGYIITLNEQQRAELIRAYDETTAADVQRRLQAVRLYGEGWSVREIGAITGCSERSLRRWCERYGQLGLAGEVDQRAGGNNAKLTPAQRADVLRRLQNERPDHVLSPDLRLSRGEFWTVSDLRIGLYQWYGVVWRSATSYRSLLHESRLSVQRVESTYRSQPNAVEIADFEARLEKKSPTGSRSNRTW